MSCSYIKIHLWKLKEKFHLSRPKKKVILEIHLANHCNLNCKGCSHYSPISDSKFLSLGEMENILKKIEKYQEWFSQFRLLGGEPLLNPSIISLIKTARKYINKIPIELVTNGSLLLNDKICSENFWKSVSENNIKINVTLYPNNVDINLIEEKCKKYNVSFKIYANRNVDNGFKKFLLDPQRKGNIFNFFFCEESPCFQIINDRIFTCPENAYVEVLNKRFKTNFKISKRDYLKLDKLNWVNFFIFKN